MIFACLRLSVGLQKRAIGVGNADRQLPLYISCCIGN